VKQTLRLITVARQVVGVEIYSPYDANFVTELKSNVPHFARKWVPERKVWIISDEYRTAALQLLRSHFDVVDLDAEEKKREHQEHQQRQKDQEELQQKHRYEHTYSSSPHDSTSHIVMHLLPTAPPELVKAAFCCLAKLYHPDLGGDRKSDEHQVYGANLKLDGNNASYRTAKIARDCPHLFTLPNGTGVHKTTLLSQKIKRI
jgi:hypothetical protein